MIAPRVSVLLPVRNGGAYLAAAIDSIRQQTMPDFELIAVDDGSTDQTASILQAAAQHDGRVRIITQPGLGLVTALNTGLAAARAKLVARMDADDIARPDRLALQCTALDGLPNVAVLGGAWRVIAPDGAPRRVITPPQSPAAIRAALPRHSPIAHPTVLMRRDAVLACGGYRGAFVLAEDYDLWLRLAERHDLANVPNVVLDYREHAGQSTSHGLMQRILSERGAQAAAMVRQSDLADGLDRCDRVTQQTLRALDLTEADITASLIAGSLGAAKVALRAGHRAAAQAAVRMLWRQPLRIRTRAHAVLLGVLAGLMPGTPGQGWRRRRDPNPDG